jgi:hypothetical protein
MPKPDSRCRSDLSSDKVQESIHYKLRVIARRTFASNWPTGAAVPVAGVKHTILVCGRDPIPAPGIVMHLLGYLVWIPGRNFALGADELVKPVLGRRLEVGIAPRASTVPVHNSSCECALVRCACGISSDVWFLGHVSR